MKVAVLAFDIERTGAKPEHKTIGIGASVVDEDFNLLDSIFLPGYIPREIPENGVPEGFEPRCWNEFWVNHQNQLQKLTTDFSKDQNEVEKHMIVGFQEFRKKWELKAEQEGFKLEIVSDNNVFDGGFVNQMLDEHLPEYHPLPYAARSVSFKAFWETHSMLRGILAVVDPDFTKNWGFSERIRELYNIKTDDIPHDHLPHHDAYNIACDAQIVLGIRSGRFNNFDRFIKEVNNYGDGKYQIVVCGSDNCNKMIIGDRENWPPYNEYCCYSYFCDKTWCLECSAAGKGPRKLCNVCESFHCENCKHVE